MTCTHLNVYLAKFFVANSHGGQKKFKRVELEWCIGRSLALAKWISYILLFIDETYTILFINIHQLDVGP